MLGGGAVAAWIAQASPGSRLPVWPAWALSALTICAIYGCFASALGIWPTSGASRPTSDRPTTTHRVAINSPAAGQRVPHAAVVRGSAEGIHADVTLWLIVRDGHNYYPQGKIPLLVDGTGNWSERVYIGSASGNGNHEYMLYVVAADPAANSQFETYIRRRTMQGKVRPLSDSDGTYPAPPIYAAVNVIRKP